MPQVEFDAPAASRRKQTILIVDDEDGIVGLMHELLEDQGYSVFEARSSSEAIDMLDHHDDIDLLIADHGLPGRPGSTIIEAVSLKHPGLQVLYISGYAQDARRDGGHAFLGKPFTTAALTAMVESLLGGQLVVHRLDGNFENEFTFGEKADPLPPRS